MIRTDYFLVIIGDLNYPSGGAPSSRIHAYSKGLVELKKRVLAISTNPPSGIDANKILSHEGVDYIYPFKGFKRNNFVLRRLKDVYKPFYGLRILIKLRKKSKTFSILEFSSSFYQEIMYWIFAKIAGVSIIREANEIPYHKITNRYLLKYKLFLYNHLRIHLYDGIIVISSVLEEYYKKNCRKKTKIIKIPILVDLKRFDLKKRTDNNTFYITYVGSMDEKKDGVISLINAFYLIVDKVKNHKLMLIGSVSEKNKNLIDNLIREKQVENMIILKGFVERDEIPALLINSNILVLARPFSRQNNAGFPTKLGEYLATGNPVVATQIGDISCYLTHKKSILLSPPGNINEFANNLLFLIKNTQLAKIIGENGKNVAINSFNYRGYIRSLIDLVSRLQH